MKKIVFGLLGIFALFVIAGFWLFQEVRDVGLWTVWVGGLSGIIGLYYGSNVVQKNIISKNYVPELGQKR